MSQMHRGNRVNVRVVTVSRAVVADQVMSQFVTENHPPIHQGVASVGSRALEQLFLVQLLEVEVIAEDAATPVESDGLSTGIVEDAESVSAQGEDSGAIDQDRGEHVDAAAILGQKA